MFSARLASVVKKIQKSARVSHNATFCLDCVLASGFDLQGFSGWLAKIMAGRILGFGGSSVLVLMSLSQGCLP